MWREFFNSDPFEGFDPAPHPDDLQGWGDDDPIFEALVKFKRPKIIVEVGSWKGASAIRMARACRELGLDTKIVCIDTWLGSLEMYVRREKELAPCPYAALAHRHGWPQLYYQFLANVIRQGFAGVITPLPLPSAIAAQLLARRGIMPDLIYIDASHDYASVKADLDNFSKLQWPGGIIFGDDYSASAWPELTQAVDDFARERGAILYGRREKFAIMKDGDARNIPGIG